MLQESEILNLILMLGVAIFLVWNWQRLRATNHLAILAAGFFVFLMASVVTIIEGFIFPIALNIAEHALYALGSAVVAFWCWKQFRRGERSV